MSKNILLQISNAVPRFEHLKFKEPINWKVKDGEHWAIIGANGSGKTLLIDILLGKHALQAGSITCHDEQGNLLPISQIIKSISFKDIYGIIDAQNSYYQQRWNKGDEQDMPLVKDLLDAKADKGWINKLIDWFDTQELMEKEVNMLSSGELRKFLIVRSLQAKPRILIMDNPFIGLDSASRELLNRLLEQLATLENLQIVLLLSNPDDIPNMITQVLPIAKKCLLEPCKRNDFFDNTPLVESLFCHTRQNSIDGILQKYPSNNKIDFAYAAQLKNIHISYGKRTILANLNWDIKRGDKWALLGANGSGKSTLLSLMCGDNPQAYANDITLFDKKRGTGESIWDIKKRIGYISPEMHLYYLKNVRCLDVVGSGFFDTIGLYRKCNKEQEVLAEEWMKAFGIDHIKEVSFLNISSGEQRLVLLARVFVKNPDLLILDEPLHGLDVSNKKFVKETIEKFCSTDKTLIYVSHYQSELPNIIDLQLVLKKNKDS